MGFYTPSAAGAAIELQSISRVDRYSSVRLNNNRGNRSRELCQKCVTYPQKPPVHTVIYGDTPKRIVAAEVVDSEVSRWDFVCVSTRVRSRFPRVLLQPSAASTLPRHAWRALRSRPNSRAALGTQPNA